MKYIGPYLVAAELANSTYKLMDTQTNRLLKSPVHADRLKPMYESPDEFRQRCQFNRHAKLPMKNDDTAVDNASGQSATDNQTQVSTDGVDDLPLAQGSQQVQTQITDEWIQIEKIVKHRRTQRGIEYLVKFMDGSEQYLKARDITNFALDSYWVQKKNQGQSRRRRKK